MAAESAEAGLGSPAERRWARTLERMRRRWPALAEAADHPLGEWFLARQKPLPAWLIWALAALATGAAACLVSRDVRRFIAQTWQSWIEASFWALILLPLVLRPFVRKRFGLGPRLVYEKAPQAVLRDIWLAPLTYRQALAVELAIFHARRMRLARRIFAWAAILLLDGTIVYVAHRVHDSPWRAMAHAAFYSGAIALATAAVWLVGSEDIMLRTRCNEFGKLMKQRYLKAARLQARHDLRTIAIALPIIALIAGAVIAYKRWGWLPTSIGGFAIVLWLAAGALAWFMRPGLARRTERYFERAAEQGDFHYREWATIAESEGR
ncbi:MAG: hypothetical protein BWZ10_01222 [candidate division BRC1 bacterium ADurb.BinA364]|nr:MAG: hypothetical protein BWZ10_01222 [candidate division BRC1 bacterium ADurb.BinA364]